jgi:hypothetical protein
MITWIGCGWERFPQHLKSPNYFNLGNDSSLNRIFDQEDYFVSYEFLNGEYRFFDFYKNEHFHYNYSEMKDLKFNSIED